MENEVCITCYEPIDIPMFETTDRTHIVGDCTRLICGHAMHSVCLVNTLQSTQGKCPLCNTFEEGKYTNLLFQDECFRRLERVKRRPDVSAGIRDYTAFKAEYSQKRRDFAKKVREFKKNLREEMGVSRLEKDISRIKSSTRTVFKKAAQEAGGIYAHALLNVNEQTYYLDKWLFKEKMFLSSWKTRRVFYDV
jgi:hypothetical protein